MSTEVQDAATSQTEGPSEGPHLRHGLGKALLIWFLLLPVISLVVAGVIVSTITFRNARQAALDRLSAIATLKRSEINAWVTGQQDELELIVNTPDVRSRMLYVLSAQTEDPLIIASRDQLQEYVSVIASKDSSFEELFLLDAAGQVLLSSDPTQIGTSHGQQAYFVKGRETPYVHASDDAPQTAAPSIILAQPVEDNMNRFWGVLAGRMSLDHMATVMSEEAGLGETGETYLVNAAGLLLTPPRFGGELAPGRELRTEGVEQGLALASSASEERVGWSVYSNYRERPVLGVYRWFPDLQMVLLAEQEVSETRASARGILRTGLTILLAMAAVAAIVALLVSRRITRPLVGLTASANLIASGDLSHQVPHTGRRDEIGTLARAIDQMSRQLNDLITGLEELVTKRTRQWQDANYQLQRRAIQLEAVTLVGRAITSILNLDDLLLEVVNLICARFEFYHAGIFLIDKSGEWAVLRQATGEVGQRMLARKHQLKVGSQSIVGWTTANRQPRIALDVGEDAFHIKNPDLPRTRSEMALPLLVGDRLLGALDVQSTEEAAFDDEDVAILNLMADQVAVAIDNAQKFSREATILEATSPLYRASRCIALATSLDDVLQSIVDYAAGPYVDRCTINLYSDPIGEPESAGLELVALWDRADDAPHPPGTRYPLGQYKVMELLRHEAAEPVVANDLLSESLDGRVDNTSLRMLTQMLQLRSVLMLPLVAAGRCAGLLMVASRQSHTWTESELRNFNSLSDQAAIAIENRRLFEETRRTAEQEALLNEMLSNLATALNIPTIIRTVQEPLARLVPFDHMTVALVDQEMSTLEVHHRVSESAENGQALPKGQIASLQETLSDQVISTQQTKIFDLSDPDLVGVEVEPLRRAGTQTCIIMPLVYGRDVLGSLSLAHSRPNTYTNADVSLLERVAQLTAVAVENARLFGQLSQRAIQLQTAAQVSEAATSILNLDQLLEQAVELIRDRFSLYYVGLFMVDARNQSAVLRAGTGKAGRIQLDRGHRLAIGSESMIGWCVANAQPRIALDVGEEAIHFDNPALPETRSELALPLISRGETIGALSVQSTSPAAFSLEDVTTLQTMAGQLANAIQNARFVEQTQEALAETEVLYVASSELNRAQSYEDVLAILRQHTLVAQGAQNVSLNLFDHPWTDGRMPEWIEVLAYWTQLLPDAVSPRYPLSAFPSAAQFLHPDQPTLIRDVMGDPRLDDHTRAHYLDRFGAKSTIFVPLVVGGRWIGFVNAIFQEATSFPESEVRRLITISNQAAVTVQGLRQLQEIQARARREALIRDITGKIRATTDLDTILQTTVAEVSKALGTSHGAIRLGVEESRGEGGQG